MCTPPGSPAVGQAHPPATAAPAPTPATASAASTTATAASATATAASTTTTSGHMDTSLSATKRSRSASPTHDFPSSPGTQALIYADDISLLCSAPTIQEAQLSLQRGLDVIHKHTRVAVWMSVVVVAAALTVLSMPQTTSLIPSIPASLESSPLFNLWQVALGNQKDPSGQPVLRDDETAPKTYIAPSYFEVVNWVPQDSAHPLYDIEFSDLLKEILLDYMVQEEVSPNDPRMSQPNGLQVTNLNGKTITFTRDASGTKVNDVPVIESETNADGIASYILDFSLFGHRNMVHDVWSQYIRTVTNFDPFGRPLDNLPGSPAS